MDAWIIWLIVAAILLILEVLTQTMWLLCLAIGCVGALLAAVFDLSSVWQITALAIATGAAYLLVMPWMRKIHNAMVEKKGAQATTGMDALIGRTAIVTEEIGINRQGRVRIDGDNWQVIAPATDVVIPVGSEVIVTGYDSIVLQVKSL